MTDSPLDQVFIVGMNGSGTTMLLDHLASHSMLFGFRGETKVLPYFITHQAQYGNLADDENYLRLWNDLTKGFIGRVGSGADRIPLPENWREQPRTAASAFDQIMRLFAGVEGKRIWCEKSPMNVHHLRLLADAFPNAKFIHIVRDGRDCAASFHRRWQFNPVRTVYRWKQAVRAGRTQGKLLGPRYHEVRYEDITGNPDQTLRAICVFLDVSFESSILAAARSRPEMKGSSSNFIMRNPRRAGQYFSPRNLEMIELVAGQCLTEFGYISRYPISDRDPSRWSLRWWEAGDDIRRFNRLVFAEGRLFQPKRWLYVVKRVRGAIMQKAALRH